MGHEDTRQSSAAAILLGTALRSWSCGGQGETIACSVSGMELDRVLSGFNVDGELAAVVPHRLSAEALVVFGRGWTVGDLSERRDGTTQLVGTRPALDGQHGSITLRLPVLESSWEYGRLAAGLRERLLELGYDARRATAYERSDDT